MNNRITVDFNNIIGKIKPMHATNLGPIQNGEFGYDFTKEFMEIGIPYSRLHDVEHPYGANQYVDIHCIFPDFDADVNDENSYNFIHTDKYLKAIENAGTKVFYRLGESIDHFENKLYIHPPKDYKKWAEICEHIIRHYNEGWANGYHMNIEYWEIWNEPDNDHMWLGTPEEFYELYRVTANHLKECFDDKIKVGGYSASGFYAKNRSDASEWFKSLIPFTEGFFKYITNKETKAPMDFFSWHCYADSPEEVVLHSKFAREYLDSNGFKNCESLLTEFNMFYCFEYFAANVKGCFADLAASMILAQKSDMDILMHYGIFPRMTYNNLFALSIDAESIIRFAGFQSYVDFGNLYRLGNEVKTDGDIEEKLYILAAKNDTDAGIMIVSRDYSGELEIELKGNNYKSYKLKYTDDNLPHGLENITIYDEKDLSGNTIKLDIERNKLLYIYLK